MCSVSPFHFGKCHCGRTLSYYCIYFVLQLDATEARLSCQEPIQTYTLDAVYTEEALVMSSSIALPLAASSLAATVAAVEGL